MPHSGGPLCYMNHPGSALPHSGSQHSVSTKAPLSPRRVNQNSPHGLGSGREEMAAATPVLCFMDVHQPDVRLMHQRRGLKGVTRVFLGHLATTCTNCHFYHCIRKSGQGIYGGHSLFSIFKRGDYSLDLYVAVYDTIKSKPYTGTEYAWEDIFSQVDISSNACNRQAG